MKSIAIYYWKPFNQKRLRRFYGQFIRPGDLCFDVGAHVGNRTQAWLALGARVVMVEPQAECVQYLRRRFGKNKNATLIAEAIGSEPGEGVMRISRSNPTISTLSDAEWRAQLGRDARYPIAWEESRTVKITTLDELIAVHGVPAFCKLDVENSEFEALLGLNHALPVLSFEYYPPMPAKTFSCLERLEELGSYVYNWSLGESLRLKSERWLSGPEIRAVLRGYSSRYEYGDIYARRMS